jgi:hypothetical protein
MTEAEWLTATDPQPLLFFIKRRRAMRKQVKQRKLRLFAVACCRRLWPLIDDERSRLAVAVAERYADGEASIEEFRAAEKESIVVCEQRAPNDALFACHQLFWKEVNGLHASTSTLSAVFKHQESQAGRTFDPLDSRRSGACLSEERAQSTLLRDIFGNPFRPVAFADSWRSEAAVSLASAVYTERAFDRLPILGDALEEAGCDHPDILNHCRGPGLHVRGCWVVDLVLGKD